MYRKTAIFVGLVLAVFLLLVQIPKPARANEHVSLNHSGRLEYAKDAKGNHIPDFSQVGYHSGEKDIPDVPVRLTLSPADGDDTDRIQKALDQLGDRSLDASGHRGALLLKRGIYHVNGTLQINHSGVVLGGEGDGPDGTVIVATGHGHLRHRRTFITVGNTNPLTLDEEAGSSIADDYVPVGARKVSVTDASGMRSGDRVVIYRPSTKEWIASIGCDRIEAKWVAFENPRWVRDGKAPGFYFRRPRQVRENAFLQRKGESWEDFKKRIPFSEDGKLCNVTKQWDPESFQMHYERKIIAIKGNTITLDIPFVHSIDKQFGGGKIIPFETKDRVTEVGIEHLRLVTEFAPAVEGHPYGDPALAIKSEGHAWSAIRLNRNTENTWVQRVKMNYFGYAAVWASGVRATVQDCASLGHASVIIGSRRYPFAIDGQLNLMQRCMTIEGRHEFVNKGRTWGPNVFVDCVGFKSKSIVGPHNHYSVGNLYDNIRTEYYMESTYRGNRGTGHGWLGTQTCYFNCVGNRFEVKAPPGGASWVIGCGKEGENKRVKPGSLYYQQVYERLGNAGLRRLIAQQYLNSLGQYTWLTERMKNESKVLRAKCRLGTPR
jgi:hypothetical protein